MKASLVLGGDGGLTVGGFRIFLEGQRCNTPNPNLVSQYDLSKESTHGLKTKK